MLLLTDFETSGDIVGELLTALSSDVNNLSIFWISLTHAAGEAVESNHRVQEVLRIVDVD